MTSSKLVWVPWFQPQNQAKRMQQSWCSVWGEIRQINWSFNSTWSSAVTHTGSPPYHFPSVIDSPVPTLNVWLKIGSNMWFATIPWDSGYFKEIHQHLAKKKLKCHLPSQSPQCSDSIERRRKKMSITISNNRMEIQMDNKEIELTGNVLLGNEGLIYSAAAPSFARVCRVVHWDANLQINSTIPHSPYLSKYSARNPSNEINTNLWTASLSASFSWTASLALCNHNAADRRKPASVPVTSMNAIIYNKR